MGNCDKYIEIIKDLEKENKELRRKIEMCMNMYGTTCYGFDLGQLVVFAYAVRKAGVDESDLKTFANNMEIAIHLIREEQNEYMKKALEDLVKI